MSLSYKCRECGKDGAEVSRLVALSKQLLLCSECIDIAYEVAHENEGVVKITVSELETLRRNSFIGANAATWVHLVRRAVDQADAALRGPELNHPTQTASGSIHGARSDGQNQGIGESGADQ